MRQKLAVSLLALTLLVIQGCGQDLQKENEALKADIKTLQQENAALNEKLESLEVEKKTLTSNIEAQEK